MSAELQDAVTLAMDCGDPMEIWRHNCPFVGAHINEHDPLILQCRCFEGRGFLAAQDRMTTKLDLERESK